jgi:hypothetical protein
MEGELLKLGTKIGLVWHRRYFKLDANALKYWKHASDCAAQPPKWSLNVSEIVFVYKGGGEGDTDARALVLQLRNEQLKLFAATPKQSDQWVQAIRQAKKHQEHQAAVRIQAVHRAREAQKIVRCVLAAQSLKATINNHHSDAHTSSTSHPGSASKRGKRRSSKETNPRMKWIRASNFSAGAQVWVLDAWQAQAQATDAVQAGPDQDWQSQWRLSRILKVDTDSNRLFVHYEGWSPACETWIDLEADNGQFLRQSLQHR